MRALNLCPLASVVLSMLALSACSEGVSEASLIEYARVAAVRVAADDDATLATPRIDQPASAQVLVIGPEGAAEVTYAMAVCAASTLNASVPACDGPILEQTAPSAASDAPVLSWSGLDADDLSESGKLLVLGTICEEGTPALDATRPGECEGTDALGVTFANRVELLNDQGTNLNHHPSLSAATLHVDDEAWTEGECITLPRDGAEHDLSIVLNDAGRERDGDENEELLLSWFNTAGGLDLHYSVLERDDETSRVLSVVWTAPKMDKELDKDESIFTLVLRDQRGGVDWLTRTICID